MKKIFVSYRRIDSSYIAAIINEKLKHNFGSDAVYFDIDTIPLGTDFRKNISDAVGECDILLALIGDEWVSVADEQGNQRLSDPADTVRIEIESALARNIPVIPVLVGEAKMPTITEIPSSLQDLSFRNAAEVRAGHDLDQHLSRLISGIKSILEPEESKKKQTILQASSEKETDSFETHHLTQETPKNSKNTKRMIYIILLLLLAAGVSYIYLNQIQEKTVIQQNKNEHERIQSEKLKAKEIQRAKEKEEQIKKEELRRKNLKIAREKAERKKIEDEKNKRAKEKEKQIKKEELKRLNLEIARAKAERKKVEAEKIQRKKDNSKVAQTNFKINRWYHPKSEPKSLYIANITVNNKNKTYRIYCPTEMVRDITNGNWDESRTATDEDKKKFSGNFIVRRTMRRICD